MQGDTRVIEYLNKGLRHELNFTYHVTLSQPDTLRRDGQDILVGDDADFRMRWLPVSTVPRSALYPPCLRTWIPADMAEGFTGPLRHHVERDVEAPITRGG